MIKNRPISKFNRIKLKNIKRFQSGKTKLLGKAFYFSDNIGLLHSVKEIFKEEVYNFKADNEEPFIIDCGSNIGLSIIYFKRLYPNSTIIAFEPDKAIFDLLKKNVESFKFENVNCHNSAVWTDDTELDFFSEGSLAGSVLVNLAVQNNKKKIKAERLKSFLNKKIDFLKMDIEGSESFVLPDIERELTNVKNLFIEYHSLSGSEQKLGDILNIITRSGFRYYIKNADYLNAKPFIAKIDSVFDLQLNIFCYR